MRTAAKATAQALLMPARLIWLTPFVAMCRERVPKVETGRFGADMKVSLENDGPFTILIDSEDF